MSAGLVIFMFVICVISVIVLVYAEKKPTTTEDNKKYSLSSTGRVATLITIETIALIVAIVSFAFGVAGLVNLT